MASFFARRFPRVHARYNAYQSSQAGKVTSWAWAKRRPIATGLFLTYFATGYIYVKNEARKRDFIHPNTYLYMKVYPGAIVEVKGPPNLSYLLAAPTAGEDPPRIMELYEVVRALKWAAADDRIRGIFADFSALNQPSNVQSEVLGLAQIEELTDAIHEFKVKKDEQYPPQGLLEPKNAITDKPADAEGKKGEGEPELTEAAVAAAGESGADEVSYLPTTIAFADTFSSQSAYLLASVFDKVYVQPSGGVPLVGVAAQVPFFARLLGKLGIKVHAEARREYKSMIAQFVEQDGLTKPQAENEARLLGELNRSVAYAIGCNRWPQMDGAEAADRVTQLMQNGPYTAKEAEELGLIDGRLYKGDIARLLKGDDDGKDLDEVTESLSKDSDEQRVYFKTLPHYSKINEAIAAKLLKKKDEVVEIAVCYLRGTISSAAGDFSASAVVKGLKEAAENKDVAGIVVRIDSGGGDVVASDSVWHAIKRVKELTGKPVVVSFGNVAASGSYYAATAADAIFAGETTVTGSIGVASLRPTITRKLFDMAGISLQSFFTGSKQESTLHELSSEEKARHSRHIDETYEDFLDKVIEGRGISKDAIEELAGGRVFTGLDAFQKTSPAAFELLQQHSGSSPTAADLVSASEDAPPDLVKQAEKALGLAAPNGLDAETSTSTQPTSRHASTAQGAIIVSEWTLEDISGPHELPTLRIVEKRKETETLPNEPGRSSQPADSPASALKEGISELQESLKSAVDAAGSTATDPAEAAHQAAKASLTDAEKRDADAARHAAESQASASPYGRGLVDVIGGLFDAAHFVTAAGLQKELEKIMKDEQCTQAEAIKKIRPACRRVESEDGQNVELDATMHLVKYPRDKTFSERVRDLNKKGDMPSLSITGPLGWLSPSAAWVMLQQALTDAVSAALWKAISTASENPQQSLRQLVSKLDASLREQNARQQMKMEYEGAGMYRH